MLPPNRAGWSHSPKYDGIRVQAHRTADGQLELYTRRLKRVSTLFRYS